MFFVCLPVRPANTATAMMAVHPLNSIRGAQNNFTSVQTATSIKQNMMYGLLIFIANNFSKNKG